MVKILVSKHKRRIKGTWRRVNQYRRTKRPSHGRKLKKNIKWAKVVYYTDQYGQISPKGRKWKVYEKGDING